MSWSLSAYGHAEDSSQESLFRSELLDLLQRFKHVVNSVSFSGQTGVIGMADVHPVDNVVDFGATAGATVATGEPEPETTATGPTAEPGAGAAEPEPVDVAAGEGAVVETPPAPA